jgi:RNA polymerase sigma factor (sigma-70 family)
LGDGLAGGAYSAVSNNKHNPNESLQPQRLGRLIDSHAAALELYASRAVRHRALNASRASQRRRRHEEHAAAERPTVLTPPPDETLDGRELVVALHSLPEDEREVVVARLWGELSFREIGELTGTSESTAHRRYQGALARLREKVSPSWVNPNENSN